MLKNIYHICGLKVGVALYMGIYGMYGIWYHQKHCPTECPGSFTSGGETETLPKNLKTSQSLEAHLRPSTVLLKSSHVRVKVYLNSQISPVEIALRNASLTI